MSKRKPKVIKSKLSELPVKEIYWQDYIPEMILLGGFIRSVGSRAAVAQFLSLRQRLGAIGISFDGTVSSWNQILARGVQSRAVLDAFGQFFAGANFAPLRLLPLSSASLVLQHMHEPTDRQDGDWLQLVQTVAGMDNGGTDLATASKGLWLLATLGPDWVNGDRRLHDQVNAALEGDAENARLLRCTWNAFAATQFPPDLEWARVFWDRCNLTPCVRGEPEPTNLPSTQNDIDIMDLSEDVGVFITDLLAAFGPTPIPPVMDAIGGMLTRLRNLLRLTRTSVAIGEGEAAEIFLRCCFDTSTTLRWVLHQPDPLLWMKFREHSEAQDKHAVATMREAANLHDVGEKHGKVADAEYRRVHRESGRWPELMDVTLGSWADKSTSAMLKDLGDDYSYVLIFGRASDAVHGSWRHLRRFHLQKCRNPLHRGHFLPRLAQPLDAGMTPVLGAIHAVLSAVRDFLAHFGEDGAHERSKLAGFLHLFGVLAIANLESARQRGPGE